MQARLLLSLEGLLLQQFIYSRSRNWTAISLLEYCNKNSIADLTIELLSHQMIQSNYLTTNNPATTGCWFRWPFFNVPPTPTPVLPGVNLCFHLCIKLSPFNFFSCSSYQKSSRYQWIQVGVNLWTNSHYSMWEFEETVNSNIIYTYNNRRGEGGKEEKKWK